MCSSSTAKGCTADMLSLPCACNCFAPVPAQKTHTSFPNAADPLTLLYAQAPAAGLLPGVPAAPWVPGTPEGGRERGRAGAEPSLHPVPSASLVAGYQPRGGSASAAAASWLGAALAPRGSAGTAAPSLPAASQGFPLGFSLGPPTACGPQREQPRRLGSLEAGGQGAGGPAELGFGLPGAGLVGSPSGSTQRSDSGSLQRRGSSGSMAGSEAASMALPGSSRRSSLASLGAGEAPGDALVGAPPASRGSPVAGGAMGSPAPPALATVLEERVGAQTPPVGQGTSQGFPTPPGAGQGQFPPPLQPPTPPSLPLPLHPLTPLTRTQARPTWAWTPEAPHSAFQGLAPVSTLAAASRDLWAGLPRIGAAPSGAWSGEGPQGAGPTEADAAAEDEGAAALLRELSLASGASGSDTGDAADGSLASPLPPMRQARLLKRPIGEMRL